MLQAPNLTLCNTAAVLWVDENLTKTHQSSRGRSGPALCSLSGGSESPELVRARFSERCLSRWASAPLTASPTPCHPGAKDEGVIVLSVTAHPRQRLQLKSRCLTANLVLINEKSVLEIITRGSNWILFLLLVMWVLWAPRRSCPLNSAQWHSSWAEGSSSEELRSLEKALDKPCETSLSSQRAQAHLLFWLCLNMRVTTSKDWHSSSAQLGW